jgi:hypothetical protein
MTIGSALFAACAPAMAPNDGQVTDTFTADRPTTDSPSVTDRGVITDSGIVEDTGVETDTGVSMDVPDPIMDAQMDAAMTDAADAMMDSGTAGQIRAVHAAPAGAVNLQVNDVLVTYLVPAIAGANVTNDPIGFTVQAESSREAIFVAIDPATLMPRPTVGDRVSFRVTMTRAVNANASRFVTALSNYTRSAQNVSLAPLTQNLSNNNNFVAMLGAHEYQLARLNATITDVGATAGSGFRSFAISTMGYPMGDMNLRFRLPEALSTTLGVRMGCSITLGPSPLWRFTAQAQPSAWVAADVMVSGCPAVMDAGVDANDASSDAGSDAGSDARADAASDAANDSPSPAQDSGGDAGCGPLPIINEVQTGIVGGATNEFVELYNPGNCAVSLTGWTLRYASANQVAVGNGASWTGGAMDVIPARGYFLLGSAGFSMMGVMAQGTLTSGMADAAGGVGLHNPGAAIVNAMAWQNDSGALNAMHPYRGGAAPGYAPVPPNNLAAGARVAARVPNGMDTGNQATDFVARTVGTPGSPNM